MLADRVRVLGMDHPDTLTARHNLADAHQAAGHLSEAISLFEEALAGRMRILGPIHSDTLVSRSHLAYAYLEAGRVDDATVVLDPPTDPDDVDAHRIESR